MSTGYPVTSGGKKSSDLRWRMPYGKWVCESGREVIYDRAYRPLIEILPDGALKEGNINEFVSAVSDKIWVYDDSTPEPEKIPRGIALLRQWGEEAVTMATAIAQKRLNEAKAWERASRKRPLLPPPWADPKEHNEYKKLARETISWGEPR